MTMGKGLGAILKAPDKLKRAESTQVPTSSVGTEQVTTGAVATKDEGAAEVTTEKVITAEGHGNEVASKEESAAQVTTNAVTTAQVTTAQVTTAQVTTGGVIIRQDVILKAISDAKRSPRISTWSPLAVGTLKSLWMTQPQFSMSDEIRTLIEEGLARKYPELVEIVKKELEKSS